MSPNPIEPADKSIRQIRITPMRYFLNAGRLLLLDLASTILFGAVFLLTHNTYLSVGLGMALGLTQIGTQFARRKPIETMEWLSLFLVITAGAATLLTDDLRYVPGWINRYLPAIAQTVVPDVAVILGFIWAGLMFASALTNAFIALKFSLATWALAMPIFGIVTKLLLFLAGFAAMRFIGQRRVRAMPEPEREALLASMGR